MSIHDAIVPSMLIKLVDPVLAVITVVWVVRLWWRSRFMTKRQRKRPCVIVRLTLQIVVLYKKSLPLLSVLLQHV